MGQIEQKQLHESIGFLGLRVQAVAVGLIQLTRELVAADVLSNEAVARIRDAILSDIALTPPRSMTQAQYRETLKDRLEVLFPGKQPD